MIFVIVNKKRKIITEKQVNNKEGNLIKCFGKMSPMKIVIEASTKSFWVADVIEKCGHEVIVVDLTIPGVGIIVATCFFATVRDPGHFKSGRDVGAYFGLVPSLYQSGKTFKRGRITKHGNRQMRWLLCIAANALLRTKQPNAIKKWGSELAKCPE